MVNNGQGRPKKTDEPKIRKDLRELFAEGYSILGASDESGYNFKTVAKYFKEFSHEICESIDIDFITRQKTAKEIVLSGMDRDIKRMEEEIESMDANSGDEPENSDWKRLKHSLLVNLSTMRQQKADIEMMQTAGESLEEIAELYLNEEKSDNKTSKTKG
jgi:hypothetical protein